MRKGWFILTERQYQRVVEEAERRRVPASEVMREIVAKHYGLEGERVEAGKRYVSPEFDTQPRNEPAA